MSFVLNNRQDQTISQATRERVLEAAERLGYVPSGPAASLRRGRSDVVLCVTPELVIAQPTDELKHVLSDELLAAGYVPMFIEGSGLGAPLSSLWSHVEPAMVASFGGLTDRDRRDLERAGIPVVDSIFGPAGERFMAFTQRDVGRLQINLLAEKGHVRIGYLGVDDPREQRFAEPRMAGAQAAVQALSRGQFVSAKPGPDVGAIARLLREWTRHPRITAVAAFNDVVAAATIRAAAQVGLSVPDDLSLVGVDDRDVARFLSPALTTIRFELQELGRRLARHLVAVVESRETDGEPLHPALTAVPRDSIASSVI